VPDGVTGSVVGGSVRDAAGTSRLTVAGTAFVLSGAGTKGAFEVGALSHLVIGAGIVPEIITATSAGSILATVLAQARTHDEFVARTEELRRDLLAMTDTSVVFAKQPWLAELDGTPLGRAVDEFITLRNRPPVPPDPDPFPGPAGTQAVTAQRPARARHHRLHGLLEVLDELPAANRARRAAPGHLGSLLTLDPLEAALRGRVASGITPVDPTLVARPGLELRLTVTALGAGTTRYVTGDGTLVEADATTPVAGPEPGSIDVIEGLLASSSVPLVFAPRRIGDEVYVDGGVLQNIPVEAAVRLGARRVLAVVGVPLHPPPDPRDFTRVSALGVFLRAVSQIAFTQRQLDNLAVPVPDGGSLEVIAPTVDVVGPFEVAQGLMLIDLDYGRMRAAEVLAGLDDDRRARAMEASDRVVAARERAWYLEEELWAAGRATADDLARLRHTKDQVRRALATRSGLGLPAPEGAPRWWLDWEHHGTDRPPGLPADLWAGTTPAR